tara:strand:- start:5842 stop:6948 length:1107 start_codon:yes stop_codon:yes gene_type:complete
MKLAVLLYGQPRFWDISHESIIQETTFDNCTTDYYFHFWDKISYHSNDPEYQLTQEDKDNIIATYKPKKHLFTDYKPLEKACEEVYKVIEQCKNKLNYFYDSSGKMEKLSLSKSIFETCAPEHLTYYLGQFVSLELGAKLINEEYDYIFRIRTDLLFVTPDLYEDKTFYKKDKRLFYHRLEKREKGIFCKYGDLQIWEGAKDVSGNHTDHQPQKRTTYEELSFLDNKMYAKKRNSGECDIYNPKTQYLHMKDWYIIGSGDEMLWCIKQYVTTIMIMIEKSAKFLKKDGIDINWSAGEIVCGEVLGLNGIHAGELAHEYINKMIIPNRILKIANKHTKECILDRPHIRVLADSNVSIKKQYLDLIANKK